MGADDLVGVMTPKMSPSQITFGRRTQVIEEGLRKNWAWGRRDSLLRRATSKRSVRPVLPPDPDHARVIRPRWPRR